MARTQLLGACASALLVAACADAGGVSAPATQPKQLTLSEPDNGSTVHVTRGELVVLRLHSTYWTINGSSDQAVLREDPSTVIVQPSPGCVPGEGCGVTGARFSALAHGTAVVTAMRTSCGEALRCVGTQGAYTVTVQVD
jgi:hypothetical protein